MFFGRPKSRKKLLLGIVTPLFTVGLLVFSLVILPSHISGAATKVTQNTIKIGYVGDSITVGVGSDGFPSAAQTEISLLGDTYEAVNEGVGGTTTNQWLPGGYTFDNAMAEFRQKGVTVVSIMLGTNDARNDQMTTSAQYVSNMRLIIHGLLSSGVIKAVILNYPPYVSLGAQQGQWGTESQQRLTSYLKDIDTLVNGKTVLQGDTSSYSYFAAHLDQLADGVHPNAIGHAYLGALWAASYTRLSTDRSRTLLVPLAYNSTNGSLTRDQTTVQSAAW